ncbi:transcriptional regulator, GntR family [Coriobacterium glomerans PW2]|uniref:Trehalose operon repressor n=1 Tax=Coriobacterium glomerans (strain ATCC 49209 / DSM 20642 / JCM 10262 / PW2) TaxID=700015 RepID=F2NBT2_CORGP|nr:trehalose operon repressor [Coriobacterium glomerans]AEB06891.1 transcriptional regulator, GntR family [Coriobacterium glomerans PW2]
MKMRYDAIYRDILHNIEDGTYPYQTLLPSENKLIDVYGCSHNTLRRALAMLAAKGCVQPIQGKGVLVIHRQPAKAAFIVGGIETFKETAARNHLLATTEVVTFEQLEVDQSLADLTGFTMGSQLIHIERVRRLNGMRLIFDNNYFLASAVSGLTPSIAENSVYEYIEHVLHMSIATSRRMITVERCTRRDQELLSIEGFDFLAVVSGWTYSGKGELFEYTQSRHRPDYFCFNDTATRDVANLESPSGKRARDMLSS